MPWVWIIKHFFLGWWILSLTFFSSKIFVCFFISLSFLKEYGGGWGGGGVRRLGPGGDSLLGGANCGGGVSWPWFSMFFEKKNILTQLMCSFCKRAINLEETIITPNNYYLSTCTRLPTTIVTHVLHNNFRLFKRWITTLFTRLSG